MKKIGIVFAVCSILFTANGLSQTTWKPFLLKESIRSNHVQLKSGIVGSFPRHTEEFNWDNAWVPFQTIETSYTSFGEPAAIEYNQGGTRTRSLYSYDSEHRETEALNQNMTGGNWIDQSRSMTAYNGFGYPTEFRSEEWNGSTWVLKEGSQISYTMTGDRVTVLTAKSWNLTTLTWDNAVRETYTYPASGNNYSTVIMEMWDKAWVFYTKSEYTWSNNMPSESLNYTYETGAWVLSGKTVYEYKEYDSTIMTDFSYADGAWEPASRITSNFDSHGNETLTQMEAYMMAWTVYTGEKYLLTYAGNNLAERITQSYSLFTPALQGLTTPGTWNNQKKEVFSNFASMSTDPNLLPDNGLSVFPNPAGKQAVVRMSMQKAGMVVLSVISISGQQIMEETFTASGSDINYPLNLSKVSPGTYLLIVRDKQGTEIGKTRLIKE